MKTILSTMSVIFISLCVTASAAVAERAVNADDSGLALRGYDPVAYVSAKKATQGSAKLSYKHNGVTYRFSSAENRTRFKKDPAAYLPQYGGYCAWAMSRGYIATTDPTAWKIVDGKLYLNFNHSVKAEWVKDIPGNIVKANKNWPGVLKKN